MNAKDLIKITTNSKLNVTDLYIYVTVRVQWLNSIGPFHCACYLKCCCRVGVYLLSRGGSSSTLNIYFIT